jgi:hypothetical protein
VHIFSGDYCVCQLQPPNKCGDAHVGVCMHLCDYMIILVCIYVCKKKMKKTSFYLCDAISELEIDEIVFVNQRDCKVSLQNHIQSVSHVFNCYKLSIRRR